MRTLNSYIKLENGSNSNFQYHEFIESDTAIRLGIDNTPTEEHWKCIEALVRNVLQPIRDKFGAIRITSGYRSVALCNKVGSSSTSNHARGQASDIKPYDSKIQLFDILSFIDDELDYRELIAEYIYKNGWIHVAYREGGNIRQMKLKDENHNYDHVDIDYIKAIGIDYI